jgi:Cu+-exporting ATPase
MKPSHDIKDPVCGMSLKPKKVEARSDHEGQMYYFCSTVCKDQFDKNPERYRMTKKVA